MRHCLPAPARLDRTGDLDPERPALAHKILAVCRDLLVNADLTEDSNFFDHGGNSLLALRAVGQLHDLGVIVRVSDLYQFPTAASLADWLGAGGVNVGTRSTMTAQTLAT